MYHFAALLLLGRIFRWPYTCAYEAASTSREARARVLLGGVVTLLIGIGLLIAIEARLPPEGATAAAGWAAAALILFALSLLWYGVPTIVGVWMAAFDDSEEE